MNDNKICIALIMGSIRPGRFCDTVTAWAAQKIDGHEEFLLDVIDPAALPFPAWYEAKDNAGTQVLRKRLAAADAYIVVTPEYNHSFPAALKWVIDMTYDEWQAKPVGFISYGGLSGGLRAVEQLRQVFAELHAVTLRDSVSFANSSTLFDEMGTLTQPQPAEKSLAKMLAKLRWWATALREARQKEAYA